MNNETTTILDTSKNVERRREQNMRFELCDLHSFSVNFLFIWKRVYNQDYVKTIFLLIT